MPNKYIYEDFHNFAALWRSAFLSPLGKQQANSRRGRRRRRRPTPHTHTHTLIPIIRSKKNRRQHHKQSPSFAAAKTPFTKITSHIPHPLPPPRSTILPSSHNEPHIQSATPLPPPCNRSAPLLWVALVSRHLVLSRAVVVVVYSPRTFRAPNIRMSHTRRHRIYGLMPLYTLHPTPIP